MQLYFAYGANLNISGMNFRCPDAIPYKKHILKGWQLDFSGVATIRPQCGSEVPGALWYITEQCEESLDCFEGFPSLYRKHYLTIDGQEVMMYLMNTDYWYPPSPGYFNTIAAGYSSWGLDNKCLLSALKRSKDNTEQFFDYVDRPVCAY